MRRKSLENGFQTERQLRTFAKDEGRQQTRNELAQQLVELRTSGNRQEAKRQRALYYDRLQQEFERAEYNEGEVRTYFSQEYLSRTTIEEFESLMRRFPNEMVTHVTRQGVRDHGTLAEHNTGMFEHHDGFKQMLEDGSVRSACGWIAEQSIDVQRQAIARMIELEDSESADEAREALEAILADEDIADYNAIHVAAQEVADRNYGAETNNEIFIAFPSLLITTEMQVGGNVSRADGGNWNDVFVWSETGSITLQAGVVFIPKSTPVDPSTGSKYRLINNEPVFSRRYQALREKLSDTLLIERINVLRQENRHNEAYALFTGSSAHNEEEMRALDEMLSSASWSTRSAETGLKRYLAQSGNLFETPTETISSEEYWNTYFDTHPEQRPSKIQFYDNSPTQALRNWQQKVAGTSYKDLAYVDKPGLGFTGQQHYPADRDPAQDQQAHRDLIRSIGEELIRETFAGTTTQ